ncbi:hypothetical protein D3C79_1122500 [compost metagenome]
MVAWCWPLRIAAGLLDHVIGKRFALPAVLANFRECNVGNACIAVAADGTCWSGAYCETEAH